MIINIRGTSGSGKSTVIQNLMKVSALVRPLIVKGRVEGYCLDMPDITNDRIYIIGRYETPCGGCDGIPTQNEVCRLVRKYAKLGHVVFEGVIVSCCYKRYLDLFHKLKQPYRFAFLSTSLEVCLNSVEKRRAARGAKKPFNPANTISKHKSVLNSIERAKEDKAEYMMISRNRAVEEILCQLKEHPFKTTK